MDKTTLGSAAILGIQWVVLHVDGVSDFTAPLGKPHILQRTSKTLETSILEFDGLELETDQV